MKEVLTATSRENWNEFVKVLELFSNDVVTKEDCLDLIGDLFGPQHNDLFHEFKRLLNSRSVNTYRTVDHSSHIILTFVV